MAPPVPPSVSSTLSQDTALGGGGKALYPIATPMECAPTGMRQAPTGRGREGHWKQLGSRCPVGRAGGFLTCPSSAEALSPHSTPETAEFLGEDLQQVHAWASHGWQGRPMQAVGRGLGGDPSWGTRLSHSPSCWPWGPQEEERERWFLLWGRTGRWEVGDNLPGPIPAVPSPRWSSGWNQPNEQPTMSTSDYRPVCRARVGQIWTNGW